MMTANGGFASDILGVPSTGPAPLYCDTARIAKPPRGRFGGSKSELKFQRELNYTRLLSADYSTHPLSVGQIPQHAKPGIQVGVIERIEKFGTEL